MDTGKIYGSQNRKKLYGNLSKDFDLGTFEDFDRNMNDDVVRLAIYKAGKDAGWELPDYDQFSRDMTVRMMNIAGKNQEVDHATYEDFIKRHPSGTNVKPKPVARQSQSAAKPVTQAATNKSETIRTQQPQQHNNYVNAENGMFFTEGGLDSLQKGYPSVAVEGPTQVPEQPKEAQQPQLNVPYKPDWQLTAAERDKIYHENDFVAQQMRRLDESYQRYHDRRSQPMVDTGNPDTNKSVIKTQGQWEDELNNGVREVADKYVSPMVTKALKDAENRWFSSMAESSMYPMKEGAELDALRRANEEIDPDKILKGLQESLKAAYSNPEMIKDINKRADKLGIPRDVYMEQVVVPYLQGQLADEFTKKQIEKYMPKNTAMYILQGMSNSIGGMLMSFASETKSQRAYKNQAAQMTEEGENPYYNPGTGARLAQMGVSFAADAPFFGLYGKVSGQVVKKVAEHEIKKMVAKGFSEQAARSIVGAALERSVGARMKQYLMQHVISGSLTMGAYNATSEGARQMRDDDYSLGRLASSTGEGLLTGAAFGVTGGAAQALSQPLTGISKIGAKIAGFGAEAETLYATEELAKMAHGEEGFENPFEGSLEALEKLGVMKLSGGHLIGKAGEKIIRAKEVGAGKVAAETMAELLGASRTGVKFDKEEESYIRNTVEGNNLIQSLMSMHPEVAVSEVNGKRQLTPEGEQMRRQLAQNYDEFMNNQDIPANVKQKVAAVLGGVYRPGLEVGADIVQYDNGSTYVKTRDKDGNCVRDVKFDNYDDALAFQQNLKSDIKRNDAVNMWNSASQDVRKQIVDAVRSEVAGEQQIADALARANGMKQNRMKRELDKVNKLREHYEGREMDEKETINFIETIIRDGNEDVFNDLYETIREKAHPADELDTKRNYYDGTQVSPLDRHIALADQQVAEEHLHMYGDEFAQEVMDATDYPDEKMAELAMRLSNDEITADQLKAAMTYYNASAKVMGMMDEAIKTVDNEVRAANQRIMRDVHPDSGMLITGTARNRPVYVTAGHFEVTPDGRLIPTDNSGAVIVRDIETGEIDVLNPNDVQVTSINDPKPMMEANDSMDGLRGQLMKQVDESIEYAFGTPDAPEEMGEIFVGNDGKQYMVTGEQDETGNFIYYKIPVDENGVPTGEKPLPFDNEEYRKYKSNQIDAANRPEEETVLPGNAQEVEQEIVPEAEVSPEQPVQTEVPQVEQVVNTGSEAGPVKTSGNELPVTTESRIPVDEKGRKLYEQATPEDALADLTEKYGEETAQNMIGKMVDNNTRLLDDLLATDTSKLTDMNDIDAHQQQIADVQRKIDFWKSLQKKEEPIQPVVEETSVQPVVDETPHQEATPEKTEQPVTPFRPQESVINQITEFPPVQPEMPEQPVAEAPKQAPVQPETPKQSVTTEAPRQNPAQPQTTQQTAVPEMKVSPKKAKLYQKTVEANRGRSFTFTAKDGTRSVLTIQRIDHEGNVVVARRDYDTQGNAVGSIREERYPFQNVGQAILDNTWKKELSTDEKLRKGYKYSVGDVPILDVLSDEEKDLLLRTIESGDKDAVGALTAEFIQNHKDDFILKGRDMRNEKVDKAFARNGKGERLRGVREQYRAFEMASQYLTDEAMQPTSIEEYVADALGDVPKRGDGFLAYESYDQGNNKIVGLKDESGFGGRAFGGDTKGFAPWLAPKGKGISLKQFAEQLHETLPEGLKEQYSDQDLRNIIRDILTGAEKPTDISNMILRNRAEQAEAEARHEEDTWMEMDAPAFQKMATDNTFGGRLERSKNEVNTEPTEAQKDAGNYKKGHISFGGYDFTIENPAGSIRRGMDANKKPWEQKMNNTYGYILGKYGKDGDHLDMFINDNADLDNWNGTVYVVDQVNPDGSFDEHKVMYGFDSEAEARDAYLSNYNKGWKGLGNITGVSKEIFDKWLDSSKRKMMEFADHSIIKKHMAERRDTAFDDALNKLAEREISIDDPKLLKEYGLKNVTLSRYRDYVTLTHFVVDRQGEGNGTRFMEDLARLADEKGWTLALTPDTSFGASSMKRLKDFYKRFGFKDNRGRNTDFNTRESMIRRPKDYHPESPEEQERVLRDAVVEHLKKRGIKVSTDWKLGQKILDDYNRRHEAVNAEDMVKAQKVTDKKTLDELNSGKTVKRYRAMQLIDGKLYPPMSAKIDGEMRQPTEIGVWEQSEERPDLVKNGKFTLNKGQKGQSPVPAAYNPYFHTSTSGLNDQFTSAYKRPELVVVEVEIPESELTSGYKAEGAKDAVGDVPWHSGVVNGQLPEDRQRQVTLSRYSKVNRIVPDSEVAEMIAKQLEGTGVEVPYNVVTHALRAELEKRGVKISDKPAGTVTEDINGNPIKQQKVEKPIFVSNALKAVEDIKQEKGTPEQWLAMITKNGGLKAGEDKWLGLSDWLKEQKGSITKQDILDYIRKNQIEVEEQHYAEGMPQEAQDKLDAFNDEFEELIWQGEEATNSIYTSDWVDWAYEQMVDRYGDDFRDAFDIGEGSGTNSRLTPSTDYTDNMSKAAEYFLGIDNGVGTRPIDTTRMSYTTSGLKNYHEIALTVPTIEPWNEGDNIHFGDAGDGRAVAWVRFADADVPVKEKVYKHVDEFEEPWSNGRGSILYYPKGSKPGWSKDYIVYGKGRDGKDGYFVIISDAGIGRYDTLDEAKDNMNTYYQNHPKTQTTGSEKVLVIDEIQSKRHQEGREKGYMTMPPANAPQKVAYNKTRKEYDDYSSELRNKYGRNDLSYGLTDDERSKLDNLYDKKFKAGIDYNKYLQENGFGAFSKSDIPDAPFEKNWHELAMKRMLRYAAENGYDKIAWTTGSQQAERYSLAKVFDYVEREDNPNVKGRRFVFGGGNVEDFTVDEDGKIIDATISETVGKPLSEVVGKDLAIKMMAMEDGDIVDNEHLTIGGEGMKGFYDDMLPRFMNKYGKKWGVKVGEVEIPPTSNANDALTMHSIDVTPEMKESVMEGQPMFFRTPDGQAYGYTYKGEIFLDPRIATAETPIHEYSHLWADMKRKTDPKEWAHIKHVMLTDKYVQPIIERVRRDYPELAKEGKEDLFIEEIITQFSGKHGVERLREIANEVAQEKGGIFGKAEAVTAMQRLKSILNRFWEGVAKMMGWKYRNANQIADRILADMLNGVNPREDTKRLSEQMMAQKEMERTLMGVHNLSEDKLKKVIKAGGLANPSMAVVDTKQGIHTDYGEISLIPKASLIDKRTGRNAGTYTGDAWTPTYPHVERMLTAKGEKRIEEIAKAAAGEDEDMARHIRSRINDYFEGNGDRMHFLFLKQKGLDPQVRMERTTHSQEEYDAITKIFGEPISSAPSGNHPITKEQSDALLDLMLGLQEKKIIDRLSKTNLTDEQKKEFIKEGLEDYRQSLTDEDGRIWFAKADQFIYENWKDNNRRQKAQVDWYGTDNDARNRVSDEGLSEEYDKWKESLLNDKEVEEKLFAGYTPSGNRRYLPNTVENASRLMNKFSDTNAYDNTGFSATRSALVQNLASLADIRRHKNLIQKSDEVKERTEELSNELFDIIQQISDMQKISDNKFMNNDYAEARLQEAMGKKNPIRHLNKEYGYNIPEDGELASQLMNFMDDVRNLPAKYFETKFKRPVTLDEFTIAVVPETTSPEVVKALKDAGLDVRTYEKGSQGDENDEARRKAVMDAVTSRDDILFHKKGDEEKLKNKYKEDNSEGLFVSLSEKEGDDYNGTVSEITRRVVSGEARLRTGDEPVEVSGPAETAFRTITASIGRSDGRMEETGSVLQAGDGTGQVESFGRTNGTGNTSISAESKGKRGRVERQIESWAKEKGYWIDENEFAQKAEKVKGGTESHIYKTEDGKYVKFTEPNVRAYDKDNLSLFFEGVDIFNKLFKENPIKIVGASRDDNGVFRFVCEQPEVKGKKFEYDETDESLEKAANDYYESGTFDKVVGFFDKLGLKHDEGNDGVFYNDEYTISDVPFENVVVDKDGQIHVVDADCEYVPEYRYDHKIGKISFEDTKFDYDRGRESKEQSVDELNTETPKLQKAIAERDKEYADAVATGDMEKVDAMLREEAKRKGYSDDTSYQGSIAFNGAAPSKNAYYDTKEERKAAFENGEYEGDMSLGDFVDNGVDTNDLEWQLNNPVAAGRTENKRISIDNINKAIKSGKGTIKMYRAVDAAIKEDHFRNGDWVTPNKRYAEDHIQLQDWKKGRIIEQEVPFDDVWWDGNDINEWGYDDGNDYAYKNTRNNRKLMEPTYDEDGNLIPLSKRFDSAEDDIRFQKVSEDYPPIFVSNAQKAVEDIKQEKATSDQWLAMITKNGGLKAGEDKWLGLSDWLKEQKGSITKQNILDYIRKNQILVEEQDYAEQAEMDAILDGIYELEGQEFRNEFEEAFDTYGNELLIQDSKAAVDFYNREHPDETPLEYTGRYLDKPTQDTIMDWVNDLVEMTGAHPREINSTRLRYTTKGLDNKREIALVVPSVAPYKMDDEVHFGDAGGGRAVAWIRFGEKTGFDEQLFKAMKDAEEAYYRYLNKMADKYDTDGSGEATMPKMTDEERSEAKRLLDASKVAEKAVQDSEGRTLVIDEIQSKRHQEGREKGYKISKEEYDKKRNELANEAARISRESEELTKRELQRRKEIQNSDEAKALIGEDGYILKDKVDEYRQLTENDAELKDLAAARRHASENIEKVHQQMRQLHENFFSGIPDAPFEKNWHELAMKRMLRYAAENGYDKIAWTTGSQQADRYDLGDKVSSIKVSPSPDGTKLVSLNFRNRDEGFMDLYQMSVDEDGNITHGNFVGRKLSEVVGKNLAVKLLSVKEDSKFDGEDLRIGAEGMRGFYDDMLVRFMNKYGKKWGVKVGSVQLPGLMNSWNGIAMHSIDVTPEMKESVMKGQPMFQKTGQADPHTEWDAAMKEWKERNAISADSEGPGEKPRYQQGENAMEYAKRLAQWNRERTLWQTAPKLQDYEQTGDDKTIADEARAREQKYPDSESAKRQRIAADLARLRHAMNRQKTYDKATVKAVTDYAQEMMKQGFGDNLRRSEMQRMLSSVKNATGSKDIRKQLDNIMNILVDNQLRNLENRVWKLASTKELKQTAQGVEAQGKLELKGQRMIQAFREATQSRMTAEEIRNRMEEVAEKMERNDEEAPMWEQEYEGLSIALQYVDNIEESRKEWADLDKEYKDAVKEYKGSGRSYQAQQELLESIDQAMQENKIERIGLYGDIIGRLEGDIAESIEGAKEFVEREKQRVANIHSLANYDLAGKDMGAIHQNTKMKRLSNGSIARFFLGPLATFEQMLKQFGSRSAKGEGYLYDYFMRNWMKSVDDAYTNELKAKEELDAKAREIFGDKVKRWSDLYKIERKLPTMDVEIIDQGTKKTFTLNQGNLLYIYMADKMADGRMKLRNQGITEKDVQAIADFLDPRLKALGDWLQDEYLVNKRTEYNKVHERMFGAPMAAIENYFPIKILGDARVQEQDVNVPDSDTLPSTITGSIVKRRKNSLPLDILNTDALSLAIEHVEDMERWAAQAEWNRDVNTLLSYTTFRNKVKNMNTIYGSGDQLWNRFKDAAKMAAGTYKPKSGEGSVDKTISNVAKGVTAAKINFRIYTAFKQILSAPAFLHDVNLGDFVKDSLNPYGSWKWAMENMPVFKKRWKSRQVGDTRLMDDPTDWKLWKTNIVQTATRLGMSPNALVDGVTCAVGAKAIYESRYKKYKKIGASDEVARKRALQDAEIGYNLTQQSSEGAFVSQIQKDRTVAANMLSVFRNSSMAYTRQWVDALRNLHHMSQKGYKDDAIHFMSGQFQEQLGLSEEKADEAAKKEYARTARHEVARLLNMMFGVTFAWNLGASLPYLLIGDDDKTKEEMLKDAAVRSLLAGPTEGLAGGNLWSEFMATTIANEETRKAFNTEGWGATFDTALKQGGDYEINPLPLMADIQGMIKKMGYDRYAAAQDVFNIAMQSAVGVNPQTFTDIWNACLDYGNPDWMPFTSSKGNDELLNSKEIALFIMRFMNAPTSSWRNKYIDELGMEVEDAKKLSYDEMAERYANYKHWKDAPLMGWLRSDEARQEKMGKIRKQFDEAVMKRMERLANEELKRNVARTEDPDEKRMYAKLIAKRLGIAPGPDSKKPSEEQWYQAAYQNNMLYEDIREDEILAAKRKEIEDYDKEAARKIDRYLKWIREGQYDEHPNGKKKKNAELRAPGKKQFGTDYSDEQIMADIRQWRKEALEIALKVPTKKSE